MPASSFIAQPTLKIDGSTASSDLMDDILQIVVEESLHLPGMFTLVIRNDYYGGAANYEVWKHEKLFEIGKSIEIGFASSTTESDDFDDENKGNVIKGEITAIETHFTSEAQAPIIVRGYDTSHRLHRGRHNRSFQNKTDSDIVKSIASEVGISVGTVDTTGGPYGYGDIGGASGYVFQQNQTNMEFLRERAARNGFELFVQDGKLYFRKPKKDSTLELEWLKNVHSFRVRVSSAEQMKSVEVRGWDYSRKEVIAESISSTQKVLTETDSGAGSKTVSSFNGQPSTPTLVMVDQPISQSKEAKTMAQALFDELGGEFVQADARAEGNPLIRPGRVVKLTGMGKYSGSYYVTETRQLFHERIYTTEFAVRGLRGGDLLQTLEARNTLQPGQTHMVGIVADNNDPKGWGRVRVKLPTLTEEHMSNWARVVSAGVGPSRGVDWLPEINDEVLVAFEHGDIHRPFVLGGIWNGKDAPPEKTEDVVAGGKVRLRTFKTRLGHTLQFVEEDKGDSKKGVYLTTVDNHLLHFNDTDKYIELKTKDSHQLKLDDKNKKIDLKTKGGHQITMDDGGKKVNIISTGSLNAKSGTSGNSEKININGGEITLTGTTKITLKVGSNTIVLSSSGIDITGTQLNMKANASAKLQGAMVDVKGQGSVNVQSTGMTKVAGSILKLN
ncbi:VgrG-related protein [Leptothoe spongobia]|uniref:VgrG-related protein n=1 Tax=Leptothoe spongobia TAU-MAC 1115 TaxID=1967444 RepID=A0A947GI14_9CYAN|nr:VgrG-related protein [Leptothoe spongobia]MBT9314502.1 VgrG-related protein [Leptothoe spongobia TAU-MAC 1115]